MAVKSMRNSTLWISKGVTPASGMQIKVGQGNMSWTEAQTVEYSPNQGRIGSADGGAAIIGDDVPMAVQLDAILEYYLDATLGDTTYYSPVEYLHDTTRATGDGCAPASVHLWLDTTISCDGSTEIETLMFPRFRWENLSYDTAEGRLSMSGNCLAIEPIVYDRTTTA